MVAEVTAKVLVVRSWIHDLAPIADALRAAGLAADVRRVDIEPALYAVLGREVFDLVIVDLAMPMPGLTLAAVEAAMRAHHCKAPLVVVGDGGDGGGAALGALADAIRDAMTARRS